jgi:hypothetical protein
MAAMTRPYAQRDSINKHHRGNFTNVGFDPYERLLVMIAARSVGLSMQEFIREASISMAMVAVDTYRKTGPDGTPLKAR